MDRRKLLVLAVLACAGGCASTDNDAESFSRDWASWREDRSGLKPAPFLRDIREVVRDGRRWSDLWGGVPPEVDFTEKIVLVAATRVVEHPKDVPRIWRLRRTEGKPDVMVLVRVRQVGGDFENVPAGKDGWHFVELPKETGPIKWRDVRVVYDVEGDVDALELVKNYDE